MRSADIEDGIGDICRDCTRSGFVAGRFCGLGMGCTPDLQVLRTLVAVMCTKA